MYNVKAVLLKAVKLNFSGGVFKNIFLLVVSAAMILTGLFAVPMPHDGVFEIIAMMCLKWGFVGIGCIVSLWVCVLFILLLIRKL